MNYNRLETSLIDVIKEEQAKLGYMKVHHQSCKTLENSIL